MIRKIHHISIAVSSLDDALRTYEKVLGLKAERIVRVDEQKARVAIIGVGESRIELVEPTDDESPVAKFISQRGEGLHHLAVSVDDIRQSIEKAREGGALLIDETPRVGAEGEPIAFVHPKSTKGVLLEFCESRYHKATV